MLPGIATFAVTLERFNRYDLTRDMREQDGWDAHAAFMDALAADGFILVGGPLGDGVHTLHLVEALDEDTITRRLAEDPWSGTHLRIARIERWEIVLRAVGYHGS